MGKFYNLTQSALKNQQFLTNNYFIKIYDIKR